MRTLEASLLSLALIAGWSCCCHGLTGMEGMRGTFRVVSGDAEAQGNLSLNLWFDYWRKDESSLKEEGCVKMALAATPRPSIELYALLGGKRIKRANLLLEETETGLTDTEIGVKLMRLSHGLFRPGINLYVSFPTGKDEFSSGGTQFGVKGAATFDFKDFESFVPIRLNANLGYHHSGREEKNLMPVGLSLELPSRYFTPIIEVTSEQHLGDTLNWRQYPIRFTQGVKVTPTHRFCFHAGYDINLAHETARQVKAGTYDWRLFFGLTFGTALKGMGPQPGGIVGVVKDKETGEPISARITMKGLEAEAVTDPATGRFTIKGTEAGLISLVVVAEGYRKRIVPAMVKQGETVERNIDLSPTTRKSWVSVFVTDRKSGGPVATRIIFEGRDVKEAESDSTGSLRELELVPGEYKVVCYAPGYLKMTQELEVSANEKKQISLSMLKASETLVVSGVTFAQSTANLQVESDQGIKEIVSLVNSNPDTKFEIGGHTDNSGYATNNLKLSEKRASVFIRFIVNGFNVGEGRLVPKGYGEEEPIADNSNEEGRAKNNRVELRALE